MIEPEQAITLLQLMISEDVTPELQEEASGVDIESKSAVKRLKARRPSLHYFEMGIPEGSILEFTRGDHNCEVISGRRVKFEDEDISLTALTKRLLEIDRSPPPCPYWTYQGRNLSDIYTETYMEVTRSHLFQKLIVETATEVDVPYQVIFTTSMINPELELDDYVIGPHYTHDRRALEFPEGTSTGNIESLFLVV